MNAWPVCRGSYSRYFVGLLLMAVLSGRPALASDEYQQHVKRGSELVRTEEYSAALSQFEAAYALRQSPSLLYQIARCHHRLGDTKNAKTFYKRYLSAGDNIDARRRQEVEDSLRQLGDMAAQSGNTGESKRGRLVASTNPNMWPSPTGSGRAGVHPLEPSKPSRQAPPGWAAEPRKPRPTDADEDEDKEEEPTRPRTRATSPGTAIAGGVLWGASYVPAVVVGSLILIGSNSVTFSSSSTKSLIQGAGGTLLIPIAGPFLSGGLSLSLEWAAPWILLDAAAQIAGLAMLVAGARSVPVTDDNVSSLMNLMPTEPSLLGSPPPVLTLSF